MPEGLATSVEHFRSPGQHIGGVIEGGDKTPLIVIGPFIPSIMAGGGRWHTINEMGRTDFPLLFGGIFGAADLAAGHSAPAQTDRRPFSSQPNATLDFG